MKMKQRLCFLFFLMLLFAFFAGFSKKKEKWVYIDLPEKSLTLYENHAPVFRCPIASGARDTPSPVGVFTVHQKFTTSPSGFGTCFIGFSVPWGKYGIHGTDQPHTIGLNASHGCIRLKSSDAEKLYKRVPFGTKVVVYGGPYGLLGSSLRPLSAGNRGSHVYLVQKRLIQQHFLWGQPDGVYGENTSRAVLKARKHYGLSPTDQVDEPLYCCLSLMLFE